MNKNNFPYRRKNNIVILAWSFSLVLVYFIMYQISQYFDWSQSVLQISTLIFLIVFIIAIKFIKFNKIK